MADRGALVRWATLGVVGALQMIAVPAYAQTGAVAKQRRQLAIVRSGAFAPGPRAPVQPGSIHGLTITRRPPGYFNDGTDTDIYLDGQVRYNSIRSYDPAPYADSGKQFPFGLDGIGGYGSDVGFAAGHDSAIYDRGP